jgi:hypothetical protein
MYSFFLHPFTAISTSTQTARYTTGVQMQLKLCLCIQPYLVLCPPAEGELSTVVRAADNGFM